MTPITITGALTMLSTNGDGPQLLTEAAEFLNALAQMGVQMAVEINLRPVGAEKPAPPPVLLNPGPPVDLVLRPPQPLPAPPARRGSADDITLYAGHPSLAPVDPTPAAPAQPEEPQWDLTPHPVRSSSATNHELRKLSREQRAELQHAYGRKLARQLGHPPTMAEWDAHKPADLPTASALPKTLGIPWTTLAARWASESV